MRDRRKQHGTASSDSEWDAAGDVYHYADACGFKHDGAAVANGGAGDTFNADCKVVR